MSARHRSTARAALLVPLLATAARAQVSVGDSLWNAGRIPEAAAAYTRALAEDRHAVRANVRLAQTLAWAGRTDSALVLLRNARVRVPADPDIRYSEALYLSWARRFDEALVRYDSLLASEPGLDYVRVGRARTLSWAARLDESELAYRVLLARPPTDKDAARDAEFGLAQVTAWKGSLSSAAKRFVALLADDPGDPRSLQGLAGVRNWQGRPREAIVLLERALRRDSTNGELRVLLTSARTAAAPTADFDLHWSDDSDGNQNVWWSGSQAAFVAERVRGSVNVGLLQANDPSRHSQRSQGEATIAVNLDDVRIGGAVGVRALTVGTVGARGTEPGDRSAITIRANASMRLPGNAGAGITVARYPFDEVAGLIAKSIDISALELNGDYTPRSGLNFSLALGTLALSDGNHRVSGALRAAQRLPARFSIGAAARTMQFAGTRPGYFSPVRFALYELQGGWEHENERWAGALGGGYGTQSIDPAKPWQNEYHADASLARRWKNGNRITLTGEISTSAARSVVGAFRYRTLGLSATLVW